MDNNDFEWPCPKRHAHGPHRDEPEVHDFDCDWEPEDNEGPCGCGLDCPGVKAHPLTQIGKGELPEKNKADLDMNYTALEDESTFAWPDEIEQKLEGTVEPKVGDFIRMELPLEFNQSPETYRVVSFDPETRRGVLRRPGL